LGNSHEEFFKKKKGQRKKRKEDIRERAPYKYLIVSEGIKTETNYFQGIQNKINVRYNNTVNIKESIELKIEGTGRNTNSLVNVVDTFLVDIDRYLNTSDVLYGHIWVIFDKDDFTDNQFNSAISQANARGYNVGWSNESFELWFLLHFEHLVSGIGREQYNEKLTKHFRENKIFTKYKIKGNDYIKNIEHIFEILYDNGSYKQAINRAEKLLKDFEDKGIYTPSKMKPATTVFKLVLELSQFF